MYTRDYDAEYISCSALPTLTGWLAFRRTCTTNGTGLHWTDKWVWIDKIGVTTHDVFGNLDRWKLSITSITQGAKFNYEMHQNTFGGRAPPGRAPDSLAEFKGRGKKGREKEGKWEGRMGDEGKGKENVKGESERDLAPQKKNLAPPLVDFNFRSRSCLSAISHI